MRPLTVRYDYLPDPGVLLMQYEGCSTQTQLDRTFDQIAREFGVGPFVDSLSDLTGLTSSTIDGSQMFAQAAQIERSLRDAARPIRQAIHAPHDFAYGIARMYLGFAEISPNLEIRLVESLQEGADWLGLPGKAETLFARAAWRVVEG